MYALYFSPGAASMAVHQALIETGAPYELVALDLDAREHKREPYLALNPNGTVPTLIVDGRPVFECAALLVLIGERHPEAHLAPAPGDARRDAYLQWMFHLANVVQPSFRQWFYPGDFGAADHVDEGKAAARARIEDAWDRLDRHLAAHGPYLLGDGFSLADLYATMLMRWSRNMPRPATSWNALAELARRVKARPSWQRLYAEEGLSEWS